jgi:hypothetical protein
MAHRRHTTKGLNTDEVRELNAAWYHAGRIGRPLNVMVTVRPIGVDEMSPADRCGLFSKIRNKTWCVRAREVALKHFRLVTGDQPRRDRRAHARSHAYAIKAPGEVR